MAETLRQGDEGAEVGRLQTMLTERGYYGGRIDRDFGPRTKRAVERYQEAAGLRVDGVVGPDTWRSLEGAGGPHTGLRDDDAAEEYVRDTYGTQNSSMAPDHRLALLADSANQSLSAQGIPYVPFRFEPSLSGTNTLGEFSDRNWEVTINGDYFTMEYTDNASQSDMAKVAETIFHESRHAEQVFREARYLAHKGFDAARIEADMHVPSAIATAAAANPLQPSDPGYAEAERWYDSFYGSGATNTQDVYNSGEYDPYRRLPEEDDAFEAGRNVQEEWRDYGGVHGTIRNGDEGPYVTHLQNGLTHLGHYHATIDGKFGNRTEEAVRAFQQDSGLTVDGVVGPQTWEQLARVYAAP